MQEIIMDPASLNPTTGFTGTCICRKVFTSPAALKNHENSCGFQKSDLSSTLAAAKRKAAELQAFDELPQDLGVATVTTSSSIATASIPVATPELSCPAKRPRGNLPSRFRQGDLVLNDRQLCDTLPQALVPVSITPTPHPSTSATDVNNPVEGDEEAVLFDTPENTLPLYEDNDTALYAPYPNCNAFKLGHWYWNKGIQKSQQSFRSSMDIISNKSFEPDDIHDVNWTRINQQLGLNDWDSNLNNEWEDDDAGWRVSSMNIQVPFHRHTADPGVHEFVVKSFYQRSLVAVIREKLELKKGDIPHFHIEPYDLLWNSGHQEQPICVYGEIYTMSHNNTTL
ncbi:hypothetical protein DXG01_001938 [Tephrocybe rancida]|nr:hypothetical protein DXG01_001938 [Tephrocybe rancida]